MIDTFHISDGSLNRQVFYATGPNAFQTWNKPQNCKFVYFVLIGGGGGGGGGITVAFELDDDDVPSMRSRSKSRSIDF